MNFIPESLEIASNREDKSNQSPSQSTLKVQELAKVRDVEGSYAAEKGNCASDKHGLKLRKASTLGDQIVVRESGPQDLKGREDLETVTAENTC